MDTPLPHGMDFRVHPSRAAMGAAAAEQVAAALRDVLARQEVARIVFAAAPSQAEALAALREAPGVDWGRVTAFHMDEYTGLPPDHPARFGSWLRRHLFDHLPFGAVHLIAPEPDPEAAAAHYAALLSEAPIDLVLLGIGVNGHLAFNDPPVADLADPLDVKEVELDPVCRQQQVDDGCFAGLDLVPRHALTLTVPRLLRAEQLVCVVPGSAKRAAVRAMLRDPVGEACPATALRTHPRVTVHCDPEAVA